MFRNVRGPERITFFTSWQDVFLRRLNRKHWVARTCFFTAGAPTKASLEKLHRQLTIFNARS